MTDWWAVLSLFVIFRELDNLPVFWDLGAGRLEGSAPVPRLAYAVEALVAGLLGKCCGLGLLGGRGCRICSGVNGRGESQEAGRRDRELIRCSSHVKQGGRLNLRKRGINQLYSEP